MKPKTESTFDPMALARAAVIAAGASFCLSGMVACESSDGTDAEEVGENIDDAADDAADSVEDAADDVSDAIDDAADEIDD